MLINFKKIVKSKKNLINRFMILHFKLINSNRANMKNFKFRKIRDKTLLIKSNFKN
jgi:hypothetical protein